MKKKFAWVFDSPKGARIIEAINHTDAFAKVIDIIIDKYNIEVGAAQSRFIEFNNELSEISESEYTSVAKKETKKYLRSF
jgi:hypothetical protein